MEFYEKIWNERKRELLDKIGKAPNPNAAARDVEELTSMIRMEVNASSGDAQKEDRKVAGLCAVCISHGHQVNRMVAGEDIFQELADAATPMLEYLNKYYDPHATAVVSEGRVTIVRDEISAPLPVRD